MGSVKKLAVIVPFYQREQGLLRRAISSLLEQTFSGLCDIIIVDDGSPVSAETEIAGLKPATPNSSIRLISQENAGHSAACNRALVEIAGDTDVVVFMDSDDVFSPRRLKLVQTAFDNGADFFFSDTKYPDNSQSGFEKNGFFRDDSRGYQKIDEGIYRFVGHKMDIIIPLGTFGSNSLAYRWKGRENVRFRPEYTTCGDVIFAACLLSISRSIFFSPDMDVILGRGVNISRGSIWGSESRVTLIFNISRALNAIKREFEITEKQSSIIEDDLDRLDAEFVANVASLFRWKHKIMTAQVLEYVAMRPQSIITALKLLFSRFTKSAVMR